MGRPYFRATIDELERLFGGSPDLRTLADIRAELKFRTTPRALNLLRKIDEDTRTRELRTAAHGDLTKWSSDAPQQLGLNGLCEPAVHDAHEPRRDHEPAMAHPREAAPGTSHNPVGETAPPVSSDLQNLARYYRDVLTVLAENSGRALRNLSVGRRYGLVADISHFHVSLSTLLDSASVSFERIIPDPRADDSIFETEPDSSVTSADEQSAPANPDPTISEAHALIRIWRKQRQDVFNRETLLGIGLIRAAKTRSVQPTGPIICYRIRPVYDPESRRFTFEKIVETPFPNLTLLSQIASEDELSEELMRVQRRIQLLKASERPGTGFQIQKAKRLLSKKRKTPSLEQIKKNITFKQLLAIFPCWVLSIDDVARIFPLEPGLFDYLIVDEASQCNQATSLHLAYRAKQMVVVGDEKQLPNASVQWLRAETIRQLLARHNLANHPKTEFLSVHESLLGLALGSRDSEVHLNEHFRCDPKIIEWSNREFYGGTLRILTPLRSLRFDKPIEIRHVPGACEDTEKRINEREADVIVSETARILDDPKLAGLSIGVISPFQPQADYIHARLQEQFANRWSECERRGLTASTADGFQGDERDIILYSLRHGPGSRPAAITGIEANQGPRRLNVAFTRARRKMILFTSLPAGAFPGRFIRSFLDHARSVQAMPPGGFFTPPGQDRFDSEFEAEVCQLLRGRGLTVVTQFPVSGYKIDLVVCDSEGRRLGVECDGPFHYDEFGQLREEDYEREEVLERAGWRIHRIPARRFYLDPQREIIRLLEILSEQDTDAAVRIKEEEDLSSEAMTLDEKADASPVGGGVAELPAVIREPTGISTAAWKPEDPSFGDDGKIWIDLARWAKETGRWTMANRVLIWEIGDKLRRGTSVSETNRARAGVLWRDALGQGFRPPSLDTVPP